MQRSTIPSQPPRPTGFTLIEVMVTIGIIVVLAAVLLAVGSSVRTKSQISQTYTQLKALEGLVQQFEKDNQQFLPLTTYDLAAGSQLAPPAAQMNYIDALYAYPATKDQLVHTFGDKIQGTSPGMKVLDSFGQPISFIPQGIPNGTIIIPVPSGSLASNWTATAREYLRSGGPDKMIDWSREASTSNADDILSIEAR